MTEIEAIPVRVGASALPPHDPLDLYVRLREVLPAGEVFLLENAEPGRRTATVGCGLLCEVRVFSGSAGSGARAAGHLEVRGLPVITGALVAAAVRLGLTPETAEGDPAVRLHFEGAEPIWQVLEAARQLFEVTTDEPATSYAFGFLTTLSYESTWFMESLAPRTKAAAGPDVTLALFRDTVWYDRATGGTRLLHAESPAFGEPGSTVAELARTAAALPGPTDLPAAPAPLSVRDSVDRTTFLGWAQRCLEHIRVGDIYQIQIGHRVDVRTELTPLDVYRRLRGRNPSPYMYLLPRAEGLLIGASPELFLKTEGDTIVMRPIAGTTRRGPDEEENQRRIKEMRESSKEQAEHIMLVDLCRNDLGRVSRPSTRPVERLMSVETFSHVFHLVSTVTGQLEEGVGIWDAVRAAFPAGTMTGAPKIRAMEIIDELEAEPRGSYAGAVGLLDARGAWSELALCIRTVGYDGTTYATQSSAGMVAQSEPEAEWRETLAKMGAAYWALTGEELL
ncbi:2-amino-4-deoxychorismate synthase [Streptomyces venezuelae]|uniref:2-amino-4-deoxychorismate synthase n=1 Tax=Streptomyces venezuelae TaxID=54571 RepID=A0A5P2CX88_STRVZ|nr:anthranilate synthase component I family protein [Streptomyces venezuelae]QES47512.1 2-amino-4-deoxychorismate synthase [Streptomyces venezuelae]